MEKPIKFSFTIKAPKYKGVLCMRAYLYRGGMAVRNYRLVSGLIEPNYSKWNEKGQCFDEATPTAIDNNTLLNGLKAMADEVAKVEFFDTKRFLDLVATGVIPKAMYTLGDMVTECIEIQKKTQSTNYQLYTTLLNNLKGENIKGSNLKTTKCKVRYFNKPCFNGVPLIDIPISEISTPHLNAFAEWVNNEKNGQNYRNLNTTLRAVINIATEKGLIKNVVKFNFNKRRIRRVVETDEGRGRLTVEQIKAISEFTPKGRFPELKQLYIDMALLIYHTFSRPADVLRFNTDTVKTGKTGKLIISYIPHKLRTKTLIPTKNILNDFALSIIGKYKDQSKGGYLLPFRMNETQWDIEKDFKKWEQKKTKTLGCVNKYLKIVGEALGLDFPLTLYDFRRSGITHAVDGKAFLEEGRPLSIGQIASRSGTSVDMISKHYYLNCDL